MFWYCITKAKEQLPVQGWFEPVPTGIYFKSSHYSKSQGQLVENQLVANQQNLLLPCANTLGVEYTVANPIATLGFGESINAGEDLPRKPQDFIWSVLVADQFVLMLAFRINSCAY